MTTVIPCPTCQRSLRLPTDLIDREVQCPSCRTTFVARPPAPTDPPARLPAEAIAHPSRPAWSDPDEPEQPVYCPDCGARASASATTCRACGCEFAAGTEYDYRPWEQEGSQRRDCDPHRGGLILILGIVGLVLIPMSFCYCLGGLPGVVADGLSIAAWVMGGRDLARMRRGTVDAAGRGATQAGMICGIVGTVLNSLGILISLGIILFAILGQM